MRRASQPRTGLIRPFSAFIPDLWPPVSWGADDPKVGPCSCMAWVGRGDPCLPGVESLWAFDTPSGLADFRPLDHQGRCSTAESSVFAKGGGGHPIPGWGRGDRKSVTRRFRLTFRWPRAIGRAGNIPHGRTIDSFVGREVSRDHPPLQRPGKIVALISRKADLFSAGRSDHLPGHRAADYLL